MDKVIQPQVDCSTAAEFLEALSPLGPYFGSLQSNEKWLFRGQGRDYPLVPSMFRVDDQGRYQLPTRQDITDYRELCVVEWELLVEFFEIADKRGLVLPDDSQEMRSILETVRSERGEFIIRGGHDDRSSMKRALSLMALAQHYGVPTRLLDWTRRPYTAAFFAGESALRGMKSKHTVAGIKEEPLVVWALYFPDLGRQDMVFHLTHPVVIVTAPSATNANLRAQQGVFTLLSPYYTGESEQPYPPMDQFLQDERLVRQVRGIKMRKFTLPRTEALQLMLHLAKLDITPSAIYPGYHSIIDDLRLQSHWKEQNRGLPDENQQSPAAS